MHPPRSISAPQPHSNKPCLTNPTILAPQKSSITSVRPPLQPESRAVSSPWLRMDYSVINESFLVPDRGDVVRDKLKFYWRRVAFYLFTVFFVFYTVKLPSEVQVRFSAFAGVILDYRYGIVYYFVILGSIRSGTFAVDVSKVPTPNHHLG
jgi:hypothetical protein